MTTKIDDALEIIQQVHDDVSKTVYKETAKTAAAPSV
jgi:hypothetical protein